MAAKKKVAKKAKAKGPSKDSLRFEVISLQEALRYAKEDLQSIVDDIGAALGDDAESGDVDK